MQRLKSLYSNPNYFDTFGNIQSCIRCNDVDEINDGRHLLYFNMIGLFSFRQWSVKQTIDFWLEYLEQLNIVPTHVTIHPDKQSWREYFSTDVLPVVLDETCTWSDGSIGGYCTEFYVNELEIGNIVNTNGDCIDVGFGLERLLMLTDKTFQVDEKYVLKESITKIIGSGFKPGPKRQEYVLRNLIRRLIKLNEPFNHPFYYDELDRMERRKLQYNRILKNNPNKSKQWWYETHGIDLDDL